MRADPAVPSYRSEINFKKRLIKLDATLKWNPKRKDAHFDGVEAGPGGEAAVGAEDLLDVLGNGGVEDVAHAGDHLAPDLAVFFEAQVLQVLLPRRRDAVT